MIFFRHVGAMTLLLAASVQLPVRADAQRDLEAFLRDTQQGRASFTQVVTSPKKEGEAVSRTKTSSGIFEFLRPNRFRFQYTKPFEQLIVADGQTLWLHDPDLNQVTARRQQEVLGNTPAALIAAAPDLKGLRDAFSLSNGADAEGMHWLLALPKSKEAQLQEVRLGFRQGQLAVLDILDAFGQRSVLSFAMLNTQPGFKASHFSFQPPAGADLVRQ